MAKKSNRNGKQASKRPASQKKRTASKATKSRGRPGTSGMSSTSNPTFGAVSTINTAPVAIGNSMRGVKTQVFHTANGARVVGRDFGFPVLANGTVTNWLLAGGIPITPLCLPSSIIRQVALLYSQWKLRSIAIHYITSSSTSTTGDIMFYIRRNEGSALPGPTTATFLPYVLSDEYTIIGPQWTNHTATLTPTSNWFNCDYGATADLTQYNDRDIFIYTKCSSADSPGYIILDYDYEFRELSVNPRAGQVANWAGSKAQWNQANFTYSGSKTGGSTVLEVGTFGTTGIGGTTITALAPSIGDVYEVILDVANSTFVNTTVSNFLNTVINGQSGNVLVIADGQIYYMVFLSDRKSVV